MQRVWRSLSVLLVAVAAAAGTLFAAAPAQAQTTVGAAVTSVERVDAQPEPRAPAACVDYLRDHGYTVGFARLAACLLGGVLSPTAVPACTAALLLTGVRLGIAAVACALAAIP